MLKRTMAVVIAIAIAMIAGPVAAQTCTVGVFADANGTSNLIQPVEGQTFDFYVVLFVEDVANAVSYRLVAPGTANGDLFILSTAWGPTGSGINIATANGENVGLGECAIGFNGLPIVVAKYTALAAVGAAPGTISVTGNADEDPNFPVYNSCQGVKSPCGIGQTLTVEGPVATESTSFGAVKNLYHN